MRKHNCKFRAIALVLMCAFGACDAVEGERKLVPNAKISLFVPANWEALTSDNAQLELQPRSVKTVKMRVVADPKPVKALEDLVGQELRDALELEKKANLKVGDITRIDIRRGHLTGVRLILQMSVPAQEGGPALEVSQIEDLLWIDGTGVGVLALGPRADVDRVAPDIERILSSVRSLRPEPEMARPAPPDAVTSASQRATQRAWR